MVSSASVTSMASVTSKASTASVTSKVNLSFEVFIDIEVLYSSNKIDIFLELRPQMTSEARSKVIRPT